MSKFSNKSHRVQNLETDGIQEVSGSIPLISTKTTENDLFSVVFCVPRCFQKRRKTVFQCKLEGHPRLGGLPLYFFTETRGEAVQNAVRPSF